MLHKPITCFFVRAAVFLACCTSVTCFAVPPDEKRPRTLELRPGIYSHLQKIVETHKSNFSKILKKARDNQLSKTSLEALSDVSIHPVLLQNIFLFSDKTYIKLINDQQCMFYSLIENGYLKTINGTVDSFIVTGKKKNNKEVIGLASKKLFLDYVYKTNCKNNQELTDLFSSKNILKTIKSLEFTTPQTQEECSSILKNWQQNPYTPYLCSVPRKIRMGNRAELQVMRIENNKKKEIGSPNYNRLKEMSDSAKLLTKHIPTHKQSYLNNLCENLNNLDNFCKPYSSKDVWRKILNKEAPEYLMKYTCQKITNKKSLDYTEQELISCRRKILNNPNSCSNHISKKHPSLIPAANCENLSRALQNSRLKTHYYDCPGRIDNEAITNLYRIAMHFTNKEYQPTDISCFTDPVNFFAQLNLNFENKKVWPLEICYQSAFAKKEEVCLPYIPGDDPKVKMAETQVVARIVERHHGATKNTKCLLMKDSQYKPELLQFKHGCFIVFDAAKCTTFRCPKKIYLDQKLLTTIKYQGIPTFDYVANSYMQEELSTLNIFSKTHKIRTRKLTNLPEIISYLKNFKNGIVHGVGCIEDILPTFFKTNTINQCRPMPFIIDGFSKENDNTYLNVRTALDDLHSPRPVNWNHIFSAVANFQQYHPLNYWTLYGSK